MKRSSKLLLSATAATVGIAVISLTAIASPNHGQNTATPNQGAAAPIEQGAGHAMMGGNMMQMMQRMQGAKNAHMGGGQTGHGQMGAQHMGGQMGGNHMGGNMMGNHMQDFDTDEDGTLSAEELRNGLLAELKKYDADGDGTLSIEEFEALHSARVRNAMVDRFQVFDEDGDGKVTEAEITAHADNAGKHMQKHSSAGQMNNYGPMHGAGSENN